MRATDYPFLHRRRTKPSGALRRVRERHKPEPNNDQTRQETPTRLIQLSNPDKASGHPKSGKTIKVPRLNPLSKGEAHEPA